MSDYFLLFLSLWSAAGVIPAIFFERMMIRRYNNKPDECSILRLIVAFICGPIAFAGIAVIMNGMENENEE